MKQIVCICCISLTSHRRMSWTIPRAVATSESFYRAYNLPSGWFLFPKDGWISYFFLLVGLWLCLEFIVFNPVCYYGFEEIGKMLIIFHVFVFPKIFKGWAFKYQMDLCIFLLIRCIPTGWTKEWTSSVLSWEILSNCWNHLTCYLKFHSHTLKIQDREVFFSLKLFLWKCIVV